MIKKTILSFVVLLLVFTVNSFSDAVVEMEYNDNFSKTINTNTNSFKGTDMKMDFNEGGTENVNSMIFKGGRDEMIMVDHKRKEYYVMDKQTLLSFANQMNEAMAEMEKAMAGMSPEERAMMEKMMKGKMSTMQKSEEIEAVLKQAGSGNVNGYSCTKYEVYKGTEKVRDLCITKWSNIQNGSEIKSSLKKMSTFMEDLSKSLPESKFMGSTAAFEKNVFSQISKLDGFPVQTTDYDKGAITGTTTFKSSKKTSFDASAFEPPAGYKKQKMTM